MSRDALDAIESRLLARLDDCTADMTGGHDELGGVPYERAMEAASLAEAVQRIRTLAPPVPHPVDATGAVSVVWHACNDLGLPMDQVDAIAQRVRKHLTGV